MDDLDTEDPDRLAQMAERAPALTIEGIHKTFSRDVHALRGIDLQIEKGEFVTLLGPSGSGKTTLLMIIAGFTAADRGRIFASSRDLTRVPPQRREFGVVFQSYALFPHMTVKQNVAYPLAARRTPRADRQSQIEEVLALVGLAGLDDRRPSQLSGGQQQRVALARALVYSPSILLLDEPLGALDRALREHMQIELRSLNRRLDTTFVYVTHDQDEALTMSDRIVVMRDGRIEQVGTPTQVYDRPATTFVANFVGTSNILRGQVIGSSTDMARVELDDGGSIPLSREAVGSRSRVVVTVRPERLRVGHATSPSSTTDIALEGTLAEEVFAGNVWRYYVATAGGRRLEARTAQRAPANLGDRVTVSWSRGDTWVIPDDPGSARNGEGATSHA